MPICPTCGAYVKEGVETCSCGTKFLVSEEEQLQIKYREEALRVEQYKEYEAIALEAFDEGDYGTTYMSLTGHRLNEEQQDLYNKSVILYRLQQRLRSYRNYIKMGMKLDALNALIQALGEIDADRENARRYGISEEFSTLENEINSELANTFSLSPGQARTFLSIEKSQDYSWALHDYLEPPEDAEALDEAGEEIREEKEEEETDLVTNPIIEGEESEF